jgi:hypothetical protein
MPGGSNLVALLIAATFIAAPQKSPLRESHQQSTKWHSLPREQRAPPQREWDTHNLISADYISDGDQGRPALENLHGRRCEKNVDGVTGIHGESTGNALFDALIQNLKAATRFTIIIGSSINKMLGLSEGTTKDEPAARGMEHCSAGIGVLQRDTNVIWIQNAKIDQFLPEVFDCLSDRSRPKP